MRTAILISIFVLGARAGTARADASAAARAFSDGQAAQLEGDSDRAAQSFELAFSIAPSKEALRSAIRARQLTGAIPRAATLAELALAMYPSDAATVKLAAEVIAEAKPKLGRVVVTCPGRCTLAIDSRSISIVPAAKHAVFANPGHQTLEVTFANDESVTREMTLKGGDEIAMTIDRPPPKAVPKRAPAAPATTPRPSHGVSPLVPVIGTVVTLGLAGAGVWSGLDTNKAHDAYVANPTPDGWSSGRSKQLRTNLLFGGAAAAGVGTVLIAIFWTRWHGGGEQAPGVAVAPTGDGGLTLSLGGAF